MHAPDFPYLDAGCDHDFPGMIVRLDDIAALASVLRFMRELQQRGAFRYSEIEYLIDFFGAAAVPCQSHAAKCPRPRLFGKRDVLREQVPRKKPDHRSTGLEECDG